MPKELIPFRKTKSAQLKIEANRLDFLVFA